jgi:hypothetical protein
MRANIKTLKASRAKLLSSMYNIEELGLELPIRAARLLS